MDKINDPKINENKGYKTTEELLAEIRAEEPDFDPDAGVNTNIISLRNNLNIENYPHFSFKEVKKSEVNPIEYVFYPCLPTQGICFIYASTGLGKTLFTLNLSYAIAGGGNFLKYSCPKPRKILYVDGEMPFNQLHSRLMQISNHQGELDVPENFCIMTPDKILPYRLPKIDNVEGQNIYNQIIEKFNFEVIVIDNLSMLSSIDENKSNEWIIIQDWFLFLRSIGKTIIVVHHAGKDKNGYRGTSRMLDCADTAISLQPIADDNVEDTYLNTKKFKIVYQKTRLFGGNDAMPYEVILENGLWTHRSIEQCTLDKVIDCLNANMTQRDIAKELFISQSTVNRLIKKARLTGRVKN